MLNRRYWHKSLTDKAILDARPRTRALLRGGESYSDVILA
jgi:hypothetical protein